MSKPLILCLLAIGLFLSAQLCRPSGTVAPAGDPRVALLCAARATAADYLGAHFPTRSVDYGSLSLSGGGGSGTGALAGDQQPLAAACVVHAPGHPDQLVTLILSPDGLHVTSRSERPLKDKSDE